MILFIIQKIIYTSDYNHLYNFLRTKFSQNHNSSFIKILPRQIRPGKPNITKFIHPRENLFSTYPHEFTSDRLQPEFLSQIMYKQSYRFESRRKSFKKLGEGAWIVFTTKYRSIRQSMEALK